MTQDLYYEVQEMINPTSDSVRKSYLVLLEGERIFADPVKDVHFISPLKSDVSFSVENVHTLYIVTNTCPQQTKDLVFNKRMANAWLLL